MKTTGEILKEKRLEKRLTIEDVEKATKIRRKYLEALENGNLEKLPGKTYARGFVQNYAQFLNLPINQTLALLRREVYERDKKEVLPQGLTKPKVMPKLLRQRLAIPVTFFIAILILGIYLYSQFNLLQETPSLTVETPKENSTSKENSIDVKGKVDKESKVFINGQEVIIDETGNFEQKVTIEKGINSITVVAVNKKGKEKKIERIVNGESP